ARIPVLAGAPPRPPSGSVPFPPGRRVSALVHTPLGGGVPLTQLGESMVAPAPRTRVSIDGARASRPDVSAARASGCQPRPHHSPCDQRQPPPEEAGPPMSATPPIDHPAPPPVLVWPTRPPDRAFAPLPRPLTCLVGRESERAAIGALLRDPDVNLLTL